MNSHPTPSNVPGTGGLWSSLGSGPSPCPYRGSSLRLLGAQSGQGVGGQCLLGKGFPCVTRPRLVGFLALPVELWWVLGFLLGRSCSGGLDLSSYSWVEGLAFSSASLYLLQFLILRPYRPMFLLSAMRKTVRISLVETTSRVDHMML